MAKLKIDKATFMLVVSSFNLVSGFISTAVVEAVKNPWAGPVAALGIALGNQIIVWMGVESGNEPEPTEVTPTPSK
jgi:hypothetical protein